MSESRKRIWTEESVQQWTTQRNDYVQRKTGRTLDEIRASEDPKDKKLLKSIDTGEKDTLYERAHIFGTVTLAWELQKHPINSYPAPTSGTIHLPLNLHQTHGATTVQFEEGDDLNAIVFSFYDSLTPSDYPGTNYVTTDGLICKHHEYVGPSPRVTGYRFAWDTDDCFIEWWDAYLHEKWVGTQRWDHEMYFDDVVKGWVLKRRGRFSVYLDDLEYVGYQK